MQHFDDYSYRLYRLEREISRWGKPFLLNHLQWVYNYIKRVDEGRVVDTIRKNDNKELIVIIIHLAISASCMEFTNFFLSILEAPLGVQQDLIIIHKELNEVHDKLVKKQKQKQIIPKIIDNRDWLI